MGALAGKGPSTGYCAERWWAGHGWLGGHGPHMCWCVCVKWDPGKRETPEQSLHSKEGCCGLVCSSWVLLWSFCPDSSQVVLMRMPGVLGSASQPVLGLGARPCLDHRGNSFPLSANPGLRTACSAGIPRPHFCNQEVGLLQHARPGPHLLSTDGRVHRMCFWPKRWAKTAAL